ncbi:biotin--[acetyl-CoA-carboxylase] ligase [Allomuricauda sp. SCSIO 65647]|uniref:biotin--[acetyl-CoA-carboxylase] ligase n=1 Tax=Allomuricauda sp. SCSIO 65647 TaxID=2908843 RepID=UPI001F3DE779|nr:biotin--[acetyl-CoA-carboxylase] ligase [Muricauda sp. SCSIO 65647]UJH68101.1 biotin--[acetyl-CoA-carboxylase] ligase [Muricauda sp. SCSIO 65647]
MQIIKLDATDSTSLYLKDLVTQKKLQDFTVVIAENQQRGRGQMGSFWQSEAGKNLTFSMLKIFDKQLAQNNFTINMVVSLAIFDTLQELSVPDLAVKWPNDILSGQAKICGVLIENILKGGMTEYSIIGVGLNSNQTEFDGLPKASSLKRITGISYDLHELLHLLLKNLSLRFKWMDTISNQGIRKSYEAVLFRKDKPSTFADAYNRQFVGIIRGVSADGKLQVEIEDLRIQEFALKEVSLLY